MNNLLKARKSHPIVRMANPLVLLASFAITSPVIAAVAQSPLFLTTNVEPNIMLMVDNSGSMKEEVITKGSGTTYDPNITYLDGLCTYNSDSSLNRAMSTNPSNDYSTTVSSRFLGNGDGKRCFDPNRTYADSKFTSEMLDLLAAAGADTNAKKTNYLNWYYTDQLAISGSGTGQTRLQVAKSAATGLVDSLADVRLGFATLNGTTGGTLLEVIDDLTATKKSNINTAINNLSATSWTPLAETEAGIGRYFATGNSGSLTLHPGKTNQASQTVGEVFPNNIADGTTWRTIPSSEPSFSTAPIQYSCQKSFSVLITDGLPTQDQNISTYLQDYDGDCSGTNSSQCLSSPNYDLKTAFFSSVPGDNPSDYLDDVSQAIYEMDLRPDLTKSNGEKNNVITYTVGIADPSIDPTQTGVNPILKDAAIQGGGKFYFAGNASELTQSLVSAFSFISEQAASSSSVATNSTQFQTDTLIYQAKFNSNDWSGKILGIKLLSEDTNGNGRLDSIEDTNSNGRLDSGEDTNSNGRLDSVEDTNNNGKIDAGIIGPQLWDSSNLIPAASSRHIYSYNPTATTKGIEFLWANLNDTQKQVLDNASVSASATSSPILDYLRGDQSNEGSASGQYRIRSSLLGDIINSDPLFVGKDDLGYGTLAGTEGSSYNTFRASPRRAMIYAGANDGMLHGFDAGIGADGGKEIFAYLPNAVISTDLVNLTSTNYNSSHRYFVDGSPQFGDAYFGGNWHTILVGSMGAGSTTEQAAATGLPSGTGGRALFALDVTNPDDFATATTGASKVLWEFSNRNVAVANPNDTFGNLNDADLGYTIPQPGIVRMMATGQWAAIVANGYDSASGKAVLFILDIQTGGIIKKIEAETTGANGLSSPVAVDVDDDKIVDYIYAGDLKGNLWKFDVSSSDIANWGVAYNGAPLFIATDRATPSATQAITSKLAISKATTTGQSSGEMIYFGTGKYFEIGDNNIATSSQVQTFYAIWDICDKNSTPSCNGTVSGRSLLQEQTILSEGNSGTTTLADGSTVAGDIRITSNCEVGYGSTAPTTTTSPCTNNINRRGWFMDLIPPTGSAQGERAVSTPILRNNRVIFATLIPDDTICKPGGTGWLMELDQNSGARLTGTPFDINNDGKVDDKDLAILASESVSASGIKSTVGIIKTPAIVACEDGLDCKYASGSSGNLMTIKESAPSSCPPGGCTPTTPSVLGKRISWRQLR